MNSDEVDKLLHQGIEAAEKGYIHSAQVFFAQVGKHRNTAELHSYLAYCQAKGHGQLQVAVETCRESIQRDPGNSLHYLILGRILLMAREKNRAISTFRQGLKASPNAKIIAELKNLGLRKPTLLKNYQRNHPLNRILGRVFNAIRLD